MLRTYIGSRPNYKDKLISSEFTIFNHEDGNIYWNEEYAYRFTPKEIEVIENDTNELISLCHQAVEYIVRKRPSLMFDLAIPVEYHKAIQNSWNEDDYEIYGRFDLSYDLETGVPKMLEFNADTPTSLYESAVIQWSWLEENIHRKVLPGDVDQFNSIHERLIDSFRTLDVKDKAICFTGLLESNEDAMTLEYLADCAYQAGFDISIVDIKELAYDLGSDFFVDGQNRIVKNVFKLYPWEFMFREALGPQILKTNTVFKEPLWKSLLSNKGILPILWKLFPDHPNLLPAFFLDKYDDADASKYDMSQNVIKPLLSREGANISVKTNNLFVETDGDYNEGRKIIQKAQILPNFDGNYAVIGSWSVSGEAAGICIREDQSPITKNTSRFVPHYIGA